MKKGRLFVAAGLFAIATAASVFTLANTSNRPISTNSETTIIRVSKKEANEKKVWKDSDTGWTVFGITTGISAIMIGTMVFLKFKNKKDKEE